MSDAAANAKIPASTLRRWIAEGRLTTAGKRPSQRVDQGEVEQLLVWRSRRAA